MSSNVTQKLIRAHLMHGDMTPGQEIGIRIDQTLTQDATGTLVMLELESMGLDRVKTEISVQYVDHNIVQADHKNPDDHLFLRSACQRFGVWFSGPGNGVSHPCHQENFGKPGKTLLGADSHTPAGGALGMLAVGAGGLEVALAMAGEPFFTATPVGIVQTALLLNGFHIAATWLWYRDPHEARVIAGSGRAYAHCQEVPRALHP
jgi:aconitate hydratase